MQYHFVGVALPMCWCDSTCAWVEQYPCAGVELLMYWCDSSYCYVGVTVPLDECNIYICMGI